MTRNNINRTAHSTGSETMSNNSITINLSDDVLDALASKIASHLNVNVAVTPTDDPPFAAPADGKTRVKGKIVDDTDDDDDAADETDGPSREDRAAELKAKRITSLRKIATDLGFDADDVKDADKDTLIESILDDEFPDADDAEDDDEDEADEDDAADDDSDDDDADDDTDEDEDDEEDEEGDEYTRDELDAMSLADLKALAKESGYTAADLKGLDQDDIVNLLLEGDDEDDVDDEDEEESDEYTEADLKAMALPELKALAKEWGVKIKKDAKKPAIIKALLAD